MKKLLAPSLISAIGLYAGGYQEIQFDGLVRISPVVASEMIGFQKGTQFTAETMKKAIDVFYRQGYFEDIWVTEEKNVLTFHFKEKPSVAKVDFSGYGENEKEKFQTVIGINKGDIFDDAKVEAAKKRIIAKVQADGYFDTIVEATTKNVGDAAVEVTFTINKGEKIIIESLTTQGAKSFKQEDILSKTANKAREFMGWLWGRNDGKLKLAELETDSPRIRDFYLQKGYLDAKVSDPLLKVDFTNYQATLDYAIFEGKQYTVTSVELDLGDLDMNKSNLVEKIAIKKDKPFDVEKLRKDMDTVKTAVADLGYAFARVSPDVRKNEEKGEVAITYRVDAGKKVKIRNVTIAGNARTLDRVIRRDVFLAPEDMYKLSDSRDSKNALKRTGYFEDVTIEEKRVSEDTMDLGVSVKEALTGNVMVGGGFGSYDGILLNAAIQDRNIFGSGLTSGFNVDVSRKRKNINLSLFNPRYNDSDYSLGGNIFNSRYVAYDYTENRTGVVLNTGKRITRTLFGGLSYQYVKRDYTDFNSTYYTADLLNSDKSSMTVSLNFDNTDDYYIPRHGFTAGTSLEVAGLGGKDSFVKSFNRFSAFYGLSDWLGYDAILRYKARLGYIYDTGYISRAEKFFMGGVSSVRGFQSSSLSPKSSDGNILLGGERTFSNSAEISIPLVEEAKMRLALFLDYGMIGQDSFNEITRMGTGAAIEWYSPMGPIQLIFANPLNAKPGDHTAPFEFTIGTRF